MQSCLEVRGIEERNVEIIRNDYSKVDQYSAAHPDAISNGDPQGKGSGHGGHTHSIPNCRLPKTMMDYSNFDTHAQNLGGSYDIGLGGVSYNGRLGGREFLKNISVYNENNAYGSDVIVETIANIQDGDQVVIY